MTVSGEKNQSCGEESKCLCACCSLQKEEESTVTFRRGLLSGTASISTDEKCALSSAVSCSGVVLPCWQSFKTFFFLLKWYSSNYDKFYLQIWLSVNAPWHLLSTWKRILRVKTLLSPPPLCHSTPAWNPWHSGGQEILFLCRAVTVIIL
jgi:hypothetical protein